MIRLIRKMKNNLKNSMKINSKFVQFDLTPPLEYILYPRLLIQFASKAVSTFSLVELWIKRIQIWFSPFIVSTLIISNDHKELPIQIISYIETTKECLLQWIYCNTKWQLLPKISHIKTSQLSTVLTKHMHALKSALINLVT